MAKDLEPTALSTRIDARQKELTAEQRYIRLYAAAADPELSAVMATIRFSNGRAIADLSAEVLTADVLIKAEQAGVRETNELKQILLSQIDRGHIPLLKPADPAVGFESDIPDVSELGLP